MARHLTASWTTKNRTLERLLASVSSQKPPSKTQTRRPRFPHCLGQSLTVARGLRLGHLAEAHLRQAESQLPLLDPQLRTYLPSADE